MSEKKPNRQNKILYSLIFLLLAAGVIPLVTFGWTIIKINRKELETDQKFLQNTIARSTSEEIRSFTRGMRGNVDQIATGFALGAALTSPEELLSRVRKAGILENYLRLHAGFLKVTFLTSDGEGWQSSVKEYMQEEHVEQLLLEESIRSARMGQKFTSPALYLPSIKSTVMVFSSPIIIEGELVGVVSVLATLDQIQDNIESVSREGLFNVYLMDGGGNIIVHSDPEQIGYNEDISSTEIALHFREHHRTPLNYTLPFYLRKDGEKTKMLGSYSTIPEFGWGVFVEIEERKAFYSVYRMRRNTLIWSTAALFLAVVLGIFFAGRISQPIQKLAKSALSLAEGDFSQRVQVKTRNEIGQLARTFNFMAEEIRKQVEEIRRAAQENQELFISSIQMLAAAVDEKDPYTQGHSARVTNYSITIAKNMDLTDPEIEKVKIAAMLHDVGKIGIDDQILKKPSLLTPEEYEEIKKHPEKGANIMSPVKQLKDIVPLMRYHHERVNGSGYPDGIQGEAIPLAAQILSVADTFDAMTTDRPYQKAMEPEYVVAKIKSWVGIRFRREVVDGFLRAFENGEIQKVAQAFQVTNNSD